MTASSLHNHSSNKLPLYQEALAYYQSAASYVEYASSSANPSHVQINHSSIPSSARSSVDSIFSQFSEHSASSSVASSPPFNQEQECNTTNETNFCDERMIPHPLRHKKKVSFSPSTLPSPVTPGSGLQLMTPAPGIGEAMMLDAFPAPPSQAEEIEQEKEAEELAIRRHDQSLARYNMLLTSLSNQLNYHITSIHTQIAALSSARKTRRNALDMAGGMDNIKEVGRRGGVGMEGVDRDEIKKAEIRERIKRLKANRWERKRFDGSRYQVLAEKAMGEIDESQVGLY